MQSDDWRGCGVVAESVMEGTMHGAARLRGRRLATFIRRGKNPKKKPKKEKTHAHLAAARAWWHSKQSLKRGGLRRNPGSRALRFASDHGSGIWRDDCGV